MMTAASDSSPPTKANAAVTISRFVTCGTCNGAGSGWHVGGERDDAHFVVCGTCGGTGEVSRFACDECEDVGYFVDGAGDTEPCHCARGVDPMDVAKAYKEDNI